MPINCRKGHRSNILILNAVLALKMYSKDLNKKFKFKNPQLSFLSLNIYILLYSKKRKKIYDLNIFENLWEKNPSTFVGYFLENDFWTPAPYQFCTRILNVRHVAAALSPLACPGLSTRPRKCLNLT